MTQQFFILGCGKMGSAMLGGWLAAGAGADTDFIIIDPYFDKASLGFGDEGHNAIAAFTSLEAAHAAGYRSADVMLLSVKPQMMPEALASISIIDVTDCCFISIAAGLPIAQLASMLGGDYRIIRTMPNTPAAIGKGITALIGNAAASEADLRLAETLLAVIGKVVRVRDESELDAVTALSGSGPAYVFLLAEAMAQAGEKLGLSEELAVTLAEQTIYGAGALMHESDETAATLRENVTSKGGTTAAALAILMADNALAELLCDAMRAAHKRAVELGQ